MHYLCSPEHRLDPRTAQFIAEHAPLSSEDADELAAVTAAEAAPATARRRRKPASRFLRQSGAVKELFRSRQLDEQMIEIELESDDAYATMLEFVAQGMSQDDMPDGFQEFLNAPPSRRSRMRHVPIREARRLLAQEEADKLVDFDAVVDMAVERVEQSGVVFVDELDKVCGPRVEVGPDVSREGVQRDLLPIVEGSTVNTRYGPVKTDHILFIAAGSFHHSKPSDLIPELQGRFPLRVEMESLSEADYRRILTEPENALTRQYRALMGTENVELDFADDAITAMAHYARLVNERSENIGARRLHTVVEKVVEDLSFDAPAHAGEHIVVDAAYVKDRLRGLVQDENLSKYIL